MTSAQFSALADLLRLRNGPAQQVARLVLVDGLSVPDAAREVGLEYKNAFKAVKRAKDGLLLAQRAVDPAVGSRSNVSKIGGL